MPSDCPDCGQQTPRAGRCKQCAVVARHEPTDPEPARPAPYECTACGTEYRTDGSEPCPDCGAWRRRYAGELATDGGKVSPHVAHGAFDETVVLCPEDDTLWRASDDEEKAFRFCPYCGAAADYNGHDASAVPGEVLCPNTGMSTWRYCPGCGDSVAPHDPDDRDLDPSLVTDGGVPQFDRVATGICEGCGDEVAIRWLNGGECVGCRERRELVTDGGDTKAPCVQCDRVYSREDHDECPHCSNAGLDEFATDGGRARDDETFYLVDEQRTTVTAGPFDSADAARAASTSPAEIVATGTVLDMVRLSSATTLRWETDDEPDLVTDGGRQELPCPSCGGRVGGTSATGPDQLEVRPCGCTVPARSLQLRADGGRPAARRQRARRPTHPAEPPRSAAGVGDQQRACPNGTAGCPGPDSRSVRLPCPDCFLNGDPE